MLARFDEYSDRHSDVQGLVAIELEERTSPAFIVLKRGATACVELWTQEQWCSELIGFFARVTIRRRRIGHDNVASVQ